MFILKWFQGRCDFNISPFEINNGEIDRPKKRSEFLRSINNY
jgi:hypothetical protein